MTYTASTTLDDGRPVQLIIQWDFDTGVWLEPAHRHNGHGRGWFLKSLTVFDRDDREIELDVAEFERIRREFHPDNLPIAEDEV